MVVDCLWNYRIKYVNANSGIDQKQTKNKLINHSSQNIISTTNLTEVFVGLSAVNNLIRDDCTSMDELSRPSVEETRSRKFFFNRGPTTRVDVDLSNALKIFTKPADYGLTKPFPQSSGKVFILFL